MEKAEVLIIGGGVIGASIAFHLASKGCKNILVIDNGTTPGSGSTGKATGGFRCQFSTKINIQLSLLSRQKLLKFKDETGIDPGYNPAGYLFIAKNKSQLDSLFDLQKIQKENGVAEVEKISPEDIYRLNPFLIKNDEEIIGGVYSPTDGYIKPLNILKGYKNSAEKMGVVFKYGADCTSFKISSNKIIEAQTSAGNIKADYFVNAAGAWAGLLAQKAGVNIPVVPQRRQIAKLIEKNLLSENMPMTIFINDGFHFRQRDGNVLLLHPEINESGSSFDFNVDGSWLTYVKKIADKRVKNISGASIDKSKSWGGLYEMTPDKHCIAGKAPGLENFYLAGGSSGHGVMHSPALGEIISSLIMNNSFSQFDIHPLRPERFSEKDLNFSSDFL